MGGFLYYDKLHHSYDAGNIQRSLEALEKKQLSDGRSLSVKEVIEKDGFVIHLFEKIGVQTENILNFPNGDFILYTGTLIYKKQTGLTALKQLYTDYDPADFDFKLLQGQFCVFFYKNSKLYTWNDFFGVYHVYTNQECSVISSSFLSVVRLLKTKQVDMQGMHEYVCDGASYNNDTYIKGVKLLNAFNVYAISPGFKEFGKVNSISVIETDDFNKRVGLTVENLLDYFTTLKNCFGERVCSALSGGYDSRLILAILSELDMDPYLYVYGGEKSNDVRIAKAVARAENMVLNHDARRVIKPAIDDYQKLLVHEYYYADGNGPNGVFTNGAEFNSRTIRTNAADLQLNGGGGEIFRNFWKLPERSISINNFIRSRFDGYPENIFKHGFHSENYLQNLQEKIPQMLQIDNTDLSREEVEKLYVYMRIKYWMGYNTSIQNVRSFALIPLTEPVFALSSFSIPFKQKEAGTFEAALINQINPRIASYESAYGYNFSRKPPVTASFKNMIEVNLPVSARRLLRQFKYRMRRMHTPFYLQQEYISKVVPEDGGFVQEYFNLENIHDPLMLSRLQTVNLVLLDPF